MNINTANLKTCREKCGYTKSEAARLLNLSAIGYGRYESGERTPSRQTVALLAQTFHTSTDFLYGLSEDSSQKTVVINYEDSPELFHLVMSLKNKDDETIRRLHSYIQKFKK